MIGWRPVRAHVASLWIWSACALAAGVPNANGAVVYVRAGASGANTGTSWTNAFTELRTALAAAPAGSDIWVAQGTYRPGPPTTSGGARAATFAITVPVRLYGGFAGTETDVNARDPRAHLTTLSGDLNADDGPDFANSSENAYHVVSMAFVPGEIVIDGFTISGGRADGPGFGADPASEEQGSGVNIYFCAPTIRDCVVEKNWSKNHGAVNDHGDSTVIGCAFRDNHSQTLGAGLYAHHHSMTRATDCVFERNTTDGDGAGMYCRSFHGPIIERCVFRGNTANRGGGFYAAADANPTLTACEFTGNSSVLGGGGVYNDFASSTITSCTFTGNHAGETVGGGGAGAGGSGGGGVWSSGARPTITSCTFTGNVASFGGGTYHNEGSSARVSRCTFIDNTATEAGGLYVLLSPVWVSDCTFTGNHAEGSDFSVGGGVSLYFSNADVERCVFRGNSAWLGGGGMYAEGEAPTISGCSLVANRTSGHQQGWGGGVLCGYFTAARVTNCIIELNRADRGGGTYAMVNAVPVFVNCTITANQSDDSVGGACVGDEFAAPVFRNCILYDNRPAELGGLIGEVTRSCVRGGWAGVGNADASPGFVSPPSPGPDGVWMTNDDVAGNLGLGAGSPCVDAADSSFYPVSHARDAVGATRFIDQAGSANVDARALDIGALERQLAARCPADLDNGSGLGIPDGGVTFDDLVFFIASFFAGDDHADVDDGTGNGIPDSGVTIDDLLYFLAHLDTGC